jgi:hypothetical protein
VPEPFMTLTLQIDGGSPELSEAARIQVEHDLGEIPHITTGLAPHGSANPGTKSPELVAEATTIIASVGGAAALARLLGVVKTWVLTRPSRRVKVAVGKNSIELTGTNRRENERMVQIWLEGLGVKPE